MLVELTGAACGKRVGPLGTAMVKSSNKDPGKPTLGMALNLGNAPRAPIRDGNTASLEGLTRRPLKRVLLSMIAG